MGAFSSLRQKLRTAWAGGGSAGKKAPQPSEAATNELVDAAVRDDLKNKDASSSDNGLPTATTPAKPPTPLPAMGSVKKYEITEPWIRLNCSLGEGPHYEDTTHSLRFLDVEKQELHRVDLAVGPSSHKVVKTTDVSFGCTADIEGNDEEFVFDGKFGFGICNRNTGEYRWIKKVWTDEEQAQGKPALMRGNDGGVDSHGRFWAGFMFDPLVTDMNHEGAVFILHPDLSLTRPLSHICIPNGSAWNAANTTMYWADSPTKTIYAFDYTPSTGAIADKRPYFAMPADDRYGPDAVPDGHCLDEEGYMWTALHGGSHVLRLSPEGEIVAEIKVPTKQPTCPVFCGGTELVITSAGGTSGPEGGPADEFAGSVFKIDVGVRGVPKNRFRGGEAIRAAGL